MSSAGLPITLGERDYRLVPQRIGRISRKLEQVFELFSGAATGDVPNEIGSSLYEVLKVFIPDLAPAWEIAGYGSADAFEAKKRHDQEVEQLRDAYAATLEGDTPAGARKWGQLDPDEQAGFTAPDFEDPYDPEADRSPTPPEIIEAIEKVWQIHGGDRFTRLLGKFLTPEMIRGQLNRFRLESNLQRSQRLRPQNGASASTTSTPTSPTSESSEGSLLSA